MKQEKHVGSSSGANGTQVCASTAPDLKSDPANDRVTANVAPYVSFATQQQILLSDVEAAKLLGISRRKFHQLRQETWCPKPRVLGPRLLRWVRSELEEAVTSIPKQGQFCEPERLRRARIERIKGARHE